MYILSLLFSVICKKLRDGEYIGTGEVHNFISSQDGNSLATSACDDEFRFNKTKHIRQPTLICKQFVLAGIGTVISAIPDISVVISPLNNTSLLLLMDVVILMAVASAGDLSG